jgi:histidinol-phosphatase (PHP family)
MTGANGEGGEPQSKGRPTGPAHDRNLPLDSHLHTDLSPDADVPIDVYCAEAAARGIDEIAITDHLDFDPRYPAFAYASFEDRERIVREAGERWADRGVAVRFGVEITYERRREDEIRDHLRTHAYDFVIGSVHIGPHSPYGTDRVAGWIAGRSLADIVAPYFDEVRAAARSGLFDTIGHVDFVKRYLHPHVQPTTLTRAPELYEPVLRAIVESGGALEVNTSGLRQAPEETYPGEAAVALYRELGGGAVTAGSDAHRADAFAFGLAAGYALLAEAGFDSLAFRRGADRVDVPIGAAARA